MNIVKEVEEFIERRFPIDCNWLNGNCYYFAVILKERFPGGRIMYDPIDGHFLYEIEDEFFDWNGLAIDVSERVFDFESMDDEKYKNHLIRDCIK